MKSRQFDSFFLFSLFFLVFPMLSCEKNEGHRTGVQPDITVPITSRTIDDCEDCPQDPIEHCCCVIELLDADGDVSLLFCGVYTGMAGSTCGAYSPPSPCSTIPFGLSSSFQMNLSPNNRKYFCLADGASFRIENIGSNSASIRISCRPNELNPGWQNINLDPTDFFYLVGGNDCFLTLCN